jgi:hypothetical protein
LSRDIGEEIHDLIEDFEAKILIGKKLLKGSILKVVIVLVVAVFEAMGDDLVDLVQDEIVWQFIRIESRGITLGHIAQQCTTL